MLTEEEQKYISKWGYNLVSEGSLMYTKDKEWIIESELKLLIEFEKRMEKMQRDLLFGNV